MDTSTLVTIVYKYTVPNCAIKNMEYGNGMIYFFGCHRGHINIISDASLSLDERKLATVSWDKSIHIWDVSTGMYRCISVNFVRSEKRKGYAMKMC